MILFNKIAALVIVEILLVSNVHSSPFNNKEESNNKSKRDVENVVSSSPIKLIPPEKIEKLKQLAKIENLPMKFKWSDNSSFMQDLEDMFSSLEREIDEMLNQTRTKLSQGFDMNDDFFSFSFFDSDSESDSKSEEITVPPEEPAEEIN